MATILVLLVCLAAAVLFDEVDRYGQKQAGQQLLATTRALSLVVDGHLERYRGLLQALGESESLRRRDWDAFDARARSLVPGGDAWIVVGDRAGQQFVNTRLPHGAKLPKGVYPPGIWDKLDRGQSRTCDLTHGALAPHIMCIDVPMMEQGRAAYILSIVMVPNDLKPVIDEQRLPPGQFATLLDRHGIVIWRSIQPERFIGRPATPDMRAAIRTHREGVQQGIALDGTPTLAAFSRSARSDWTFIVGVPQAQAAASMVRTLYLGVAATFGLLLFGGVIGLLTAQRVSKAMGHLSSAALRIREGYPPAYEPSGLSEIDAVGTALDEAIAARDRSEQRLNLAEALRKTEEALRQSQKMESIGQITGGLAHDFNNLLSPIVGTLDMLKHRGLPDARSEMLVDTAADAAERARLLVQRLLAFARRQPLQTSAVNVRQLIDGLRGLLGSTIGARSTLEIVGDAASPARADANQLEMAILNLAVNARDAMPDGGRITIGIAQRTITANEEADVAAGDYITIAVADSGTGMSPEVVARAIEPFFSTKGTERGTGLGLSMVHGLTAQLGGGMRIDTEPGLGTTITLLLPVAELPTLSDPDSRSAAADDERRGTALLVDDEPLVRSSINHMLAGLGYSVIEVGSAKEAIAVLEGPVGIDILVTDHMMPGMTGTELAHLARANFPDIPVLIVSGYADVDDIAPDFPRLSKPFRQVQLGRAVAALGRPKEPG